MFFCTCDGEPCCVAVVLPVAGTVCELKNITAASAFQRRGFGEQMVRYLQGDYRGKFSIMIVGTADVSMMAKNFYQRCGFVISRLVKNFFVDNYR